jgi:hypothetical protein
MYNKRVGHATVADSIGNALEPRYIPQQAHIETSEYYANPIYPPMDVSQTFANPMYRPIQMMDDQSHAASLSPETILKIAELKRLVNKYPQFHTMDADKIVKWAIYSSSNHDNKFLDDMLNSFVAFDSLANSNRSH